MARTSDKAKDEAAQFDGTVLVECRVPNIWTSRGKLLKGDRREVPADEAKALGKAVEVVT